MGSEIEINALPFMNLKNFQPENDTTDYIRTKMYYCSFAKVGYINYTSVYRFHKMTDLEDIRGMCRAKLTLVDTFVWLAIVLGLPGNIVAFITLLTMPQTTGTFFFSLLSFSDLIALCTRCCYSLFLRYKLYYPSHLCWIMHFIMNYSLTYANWVLVFLCLERFITVRFPLQKSYYFTLRRARYSGVVLAVVLLPVFFVFFFLTESSNGVCIHSPGMEYFYRKIFSHIIEALYSFMPAALLLLFTILVMIELKRHQRTRKLLLTDMPSDGQDAGQLNLARTETAHSRKRRREAEALGRSITIMMMVTAFTFLLLTIPLCVVTIIVLDYKSKDQTNVSYARYDLLWTAVLSINMMSHAINFYIYFLSTRKFRRHLCSLLVRKKTMRPQGPSLMSKSTRLNV